VAVAIIPESLIAVLTITQSVGAKAMARGNVLVRKITSLEAVGGTTNICSDKTGTLTQGKMVATQVWIPQQDSIGTVNILDVGHPYDPESGTVQRANIDAPSFGSQNPLSELLRTMALCNLASVSHGKAEEPSNIGTELVNTPAGEWVANGEPTEVALQVLAMRFGLGKSEIIAHEKLQLVAEYPFSSADKRMTVVYRREDGVFHAFTKGATEVILDKTTVSESMKILTRNQLDKFASQGLRVLGFGCRTFTFDSSQRFEQEDRAEIEQKLEFLGLVGIQDPPRPETEGAVRKAQIAGIKVLRSHSFNPLLL
jgi:magnesium-transporting ATPase (P-type)